MIKKRNVKILVTIALLLCCVSSYIVTYANGKTLKKDVCEMATAMAKVEKCYDVGYACAAEDEKAGQDTMTFYQVSYQVDGKEYIVRMKENEQLKGLKAGDNLEIRYSVETPKLVYAAK
ncbi:MAG: hypothetical protein ACI4A3_09985 [Lachnospiraceae bacterium]